MGRPRKEIPTRRYYLTLEQPVADRLEAYADSVRRPTATAAASLLANALARLNTPEEDELREARRQIDELTTRVQALRRQLSQRRWSEPEEVPARWEWPLDALLADTEWWDRWLPRFNELMGRRIGGFVSNQRDGLHSRPELPSSAALDPRGYADILGFLFPPIVDGLRVFTWRSTDYATIHRQQAAPGGQTVAQLRTQVFDPVIRHAAEALSALEYTGHGSADAYLRLRAEAEITGSWARILRYLLGEDAPVLPQRQVL